MAYGMMDQIANHFCNFLEKDRITEGSDKGTLMHMIEEAKPGAKPFYNMAQTFFDQAKRYWEYTGDREFAKKVFPVLEDHIGWELRKHKPDEEWLFENRLNTWISDSHWTIEGHCTQASSYMYNIFCFAADLAELTKQPEKQKYYTGLAEQVKEALHRVLWQKRKGIFGYAKDTRNHKLFHPEPELGDIYHPSEFGVADAFETYQMLDWVEANARCEQLDNGAQIYWSADWHPNRGHQSTHSTSILCQGEEMNLAMIYHSLGLAEEAYKIFSSAYMPLYGIQGQERKQSGAVDFIAGDFPCQLKTDGTTEGNPHFADSISMFGRALYEGMIGIRPMLQKGEIRVTPCFPKELPNVDVCSEVIDYRYEQTSEQVNISYDTKGKNCLLRMTIHLPVAQVKSVQMDGMTIPYEVESGFGMIHVKVVRQIDGEEKQKGCLCIVYTEKELLPIEQRRRLRTGDLLELKYPGEQILEVLDPQNVLETINIEGNCISASVAGEEGSGVFFLKMIAGETIYIRPVKLQILPVKEMPQKLFVGYKEEFKAPYQWDFVNMDDLFTASSPGEVLNAVKAAVIRPPQEYNQMNTDYYLMHIDNYIQQFNTYPLSDDRWRSMVGEDGIAVTGEGIPFRSPKEGVNLAVTTLAATGYPDRVQVPVEMAGRAIYLLITGITFPMQSHVENLRITFTYEDGVSQEYPLINPYDIGDMWFVMWNRYHDTPANGFENLSGRRGALTSAGLDLNSPIETDTEAHILRFYLREGVKVTKMEMRTIANDAIFALMGVTVLQ